MSMFAKKIRTHLTTVGLLGVAVATFAVNTRVTAADAPVDRTTKESVILFLVDHSESMQDFPMPPTVQACLLHVLHLAELTTEPPKIGVIFYGGTSVTVVGDDRQLPTAAIGSLRKRLLTEWPALEGTTPMDSAFAAATRIVQQFPESTDVSIVLIGDGLPDSGFLRPDGFPEIQEAILRQKAAITTKNAGFPPTIVQEVLNRFEQELRDPSTKTFQNLYVEQIKLELAATLRHAESLHARRVRFITLSFADIPPLMDIHEAAGGARQDFVQTPPHTVIERIHDLHLLDLPRVVQLPTLEITADPTLFEQTITVPVEVIGDAAVIAVEFRPAIPSLSEHAHLEAIVDGTTLTYSTDGTQPEAVLSTDAAGNVAIATLRLSHVPDSHSITFRWHSPDASLSLPACSIYSFVRLRDDLTLELRPTFAEQAAIPPYTVSPRHSATWSATLRIGNAAKPYPLAALEAVFRHRRSRDEQHVAFEPDPRAIGVFQSAALNLEAGQYDVELHLQLESGINFRSKLEDHIHCVLADERVAVEIRQPGRDAEFASYDRRWISFGSSIGDTVHRVTVEMNLRSAGIDYPLPVLLDAQIADPDGQVPDQQWVTFSRRQLTLHPGRPERVRVTLQLPEDIEKAIQDGLFTGRFMVLRVENREPLVLERFQELSGVTEDDPVDRITFELQRPRFTLKLPYAFADWLKVAADERLHTTIRVSIDAYFRRTVTVVVRHDSRQLRRVTVLPSGLITDRQGHQVAAIRLTPLDDEAAQEIPPGGTGQWRFLFEMERDCDVQHAQAGFDISAPGVIPSHVDVNIQRAEPMLASAFRIGFWIVLALLGLLLLRALFRYRWVAPLTTGRQHEVTAARPLAYLLRFEEHARGLAPVVTQDCRVTLPGKQHARLLGSEQQLRLPQMSEDEVLRVQPGDDGDEPVFSVRPTLLSSDVEPELLVEVEHGGKFDSLAETAKRTMLAGSVLGGLVVYIVLNLSRPHVLETVQWAYDLLVPLT